MDIVSIENHENPKLNSDNFQFNCFRIIDESTVSHWHSHLEIVYIDRGSCKVYIDGFEYICNEGSILLIPQGSLHSIIVDVAVTVTYFAFVIGETLLHPMFNDTHCKDIISPLFSSKLQQCLMFNSSDNIHPKIIKSINCIIKEIESESIGYELIVKAELCLLFTNMIRALPNFNDNDKNSESKKSQKMKIVLDYISENFSKKIPISYISKYLNMSDQHFCRVFKAYTGKTFVAFLTDYRLERAKTLIDTTDLPITLIPELTGFCNSNYFSRVYKNKYGFPPSYSRKTDI